MTKLCSFALALALAQGVLSVGPQCNADNCARAVTGTRTGKMPNISSRMADCSSFQLTTITPAASTATAFVTVTVALPHKRDNVAVAARQVTISSVSIPVYASACIGAVRYKSACSCWGITAAVSTAPAPVVTVVSTVTVTPSVTGPGYQPLLPTTYTGCLFDPAAPGTFELLDPQALPIVDKNGKAVEAAQVILNVDPFSFSHPAAAPMGVYDIVLTSNGQTSYFAVFKSGMVGFTASSSNGQTYVNDGNGDQYITTIWSLQCDGIVTAGIVGGVEFQFSINNNGDVVETSFFPTSRRVRDIPVPKGFHLSPLKFPTLPTTVRCPANQHAVTKNPPKPLFSDGCGGGLTRPITPQFDFVACCNSHDVCFDDCSQTFQGCNNNLLSCINGVCDTFHSGDKFEHWRCSNAANAFYFAVSTAGAINFGDSTKYWCDCKCNDPSLSPCGDACVNEMTDPFNCGNCSFFCPSGSCTNGACSFSSCTGQTCSTFGSCGPGGSCVCASITGGTGFCVDGNTPCAGLLGCGTSANCPLGSVCAVGTCCGNNVCIGIDYCGGFTHKNKMLLIRGNITGATIAHLAGPW